MSKIFLLIITIFSSNRSFECDKSNSDFELHHQNELQNKTIDSIWSANKIIGKGGFGIVKEFDWFLNNNSFKIALKQMVIPDDVTEDLITMQIEPLQKEVDNLVKFSHSYPNLFPIFYGCSINLHDPLGPVDFYIFQEKLFADLDKKKADFMNKKTLLQRVEIYGKLFESLAIMHENGYVHSDIKPANIMTNNENFDVLKLIDFGATDLIGEDIAAGSPAYNAPEKINFKYINEEQQEIKIDTLAEAQDVWALGVSIMSIESRGTFIFSGINKECFTRDFNKDCYNNFLTNYGEVVNKIFIKPNFSKFLKKLVFFNPELRPSARKATIKFESFAQNANNLEDIELTSIPTIHKVFKPKSNDENLVKFLEKSFNKQELNEMRKVEIKEQIDGNFGIGSKVFNHNGRKFYSKLNNKKLLENKNLNPPEYKEIKELIQNQKLNKNLISPTILKIKKKLILHPKNNSNLKIKFMNSNNNDLENEGYPMKRKSGNDLFKRKISNKFDNSQDKIEEINKNEINLDPRKKKKLNRLPSLNNTGDMKNDFTKINQPIKLRSNDNKLNVNREDIRNLIKLQQKNDHVPVIKMKNILLNQKDMERKII